MPPVFSIFPKFLRGLSVDDLAERLLACGLGAVNAVVRDGYWVTSDSLPTALGPFVQRLRAHGLACPMCTAGWSADEIAAHPDWLRVLADAGITRYRIGYVRRGDDPAGALDDARRWFETVAASSARAGIQAVYQVHHGTALPSPTLAWTLLRDLDPAHVAIEVDPGNQVHEGWESPGPSYRLLGPHLSAIGVKDARWHHDPTAADTPGKGWRRDWCACHQGIIDWQQVFTALADVGFTGPLVLMPFYHPDDVDAHLRVLADEVAYLRRVAAASNLLPTPSTARTP